MGTLALPTFKSRFNQDHLWARKKKNIKQRLFASKDYSCLFSDPVSPAKVCCCLKYGCVF